MRIAIKQLSMLAAFAAIPAVLHGQAILMPGDPILAIDLDESSRSSYPPAEGPANVLDGVAGTKYLNFGQRNTGAIVTPSLTSTIRSMRFATANDSPARDPASWRLFGTNDPILSTDNSQGNGENWTLIDSGNVILPDTRLTLSDPIAVNNAAMYSSYRLLFPTLKEDCNANSMQIGDVYLYESGDGMGANVLAPGNPILAIQPLTSESRYPCGERPTLAIDGNPNTKYLNFGRENSGFIVTPSMGAQVVRQFQLTTANDAPARDPGSWTLWGTNDPITSPDNSIGSGENWTFIDAGVLDLPLARFADGDLVNVNNNTAYTSYRMVFPSVRDVANANSMQFSRVQFFVPEPSTWGLILVSAWAASRMFR